MKNRNRIITSKFLLLKTYAVLLTVLIITAGCVPPETTVNNTNTNGANLTANNANGADNNADEADSSNNISTIGSGEEANLSPEEYERGRTDQDWKQYVQIEASDEKSSGANPEKLEDITPERVNTGKTHLPLSGSGVGPSVLRAQLLLDRSPFSPGIIDGKWGKNTEKAVYWMQKREGLKASGTIDQKTFERLSQLAGNPEKLIIERKLTAEDVKGPFEKLPSDIYEQAKLDCMCYESLEEKLSEMFHVSPELLGRLNPKVKLNDLKAGDTINVPNLEENKNDSAGKVERIVISDGGKYLHAMDGNGNILYHFPSTLGSSYSPSPDGEYKITAIAEDPTWHYQPKILTGVDNSGKDAIIPAGPNNPVGKVWMSLSKPHFGIHGTKAPETIGYATSNGCVRLTNWDIQSLRQKVSKGITVEFRDTRNQSESKS